MTSARHGTDGNPYDLMPALGAIPIGEEPSPLSPEARP